MKEVCPDHINKSPTTRELKLLFKWFRHYFPSRWRGQICSSRNHRGKGSLSHWSSKASYSYLVSHIEKICNTLIVNYLIHKHAHSMCYACLHTCSWLISRNMRDLNTVSVWSFARDQVLTKTGFPKGLFLTSSGAPHTDRGSLYHHVTSRWPIPLLDSRNVGYNSIHLPFPLPSLYINHPKTKPLVVIVNVIMFVCSSLNVPLHLVRVYHSVPLAYCLSK